MSTFGPAYDEAIDGARIEKQHERIRDLMLDGQRRTLSEIAVATGYPESSISAQLRHLRKAKFGSWNVYKERLGGGLWTYWIDGQKQSTMRVDEGPRNEDGTPKFQRWWVLWLKSRGAPATGYAEGELLEGFGQSYVYSRWIEGRWEAWARSKGVTELGPHPWHTWYGAAASKGHTHAGFAAWLEENWA